MNSFLPINKNADWWLLLLAFSLLAILIIAGMGLRDPWPPDEPRFALMAKEMVETGQWFFPHRGGEIYPDKPPLLMWAVALVFWLTGNLKVAFLLPSAIASLLVLWMTWDLTKRLWGRKIAYYAVFLLGFSIQFMMLAKSGQLDAMVSMWIMLGCYGLLRHILNGPDWSWYYMGWFAMGLGIITKGVGFLPIFLLIPLIWLRPSWQHNEHSKWNRLKWLLGPLFMLAAIFLWLGPMLLQVDAYNASELISYKNNILFKQTAERYANSWGHIKPFWYYFTSVIPIYWMPFSLLFFWSWKPWIKSIKAKDQRIILPLFWVVAVVIFFSLSKGKRSVYLLPALPMLAVIVAPFIEQMLQQKKFKTILISLLFLLANLLIVIGLAGVFGQEKLHSISLKYGADPWLWILFMGLAAMLVLVLLRKSLVTCYLVSFAVYTLMTSLWGYRVLDKARSTQDMMAAIAKKIPVDAELAIIDFREKLLIHSNWPITHFGYHSQIEAEYISAKSWLAEKPGRYLLINDDAIKPCIKASSLITYQSPQNKFWPLFDANVLDNCLFESEYPAKSFRSKK